MRLTDRVTVIGLAALAPIALAALPRPSLAPEAQDQLACILMNTDRLPLESRRSPIDSLSFTVKANPVKICYSRPSARGRTMLGGRLPYGQLWRTGANEPTMFHTSTALAIAGIRVPAGSYSLYTVPGESEWQIIVNRSITQWGHERYYTGEVEAEEVGRVTVKSSQTEDHVETFTISSTPTAEGNALLILEWERTRVEMPVSSS